MHSQEQLKLQLAAANHYAENLNEECELWLSERGISRSVAQKFSLGTVTNAIPGHEHHEGWISIPYLTALGLCVGFKFRRIDEGKPKYGSPAGQKSHLYNVNGVLERSRIIAICEGEFDAIICSGVLGIPAIGVPGVAAWKSHYPKLFNGFDEVLVIGDNDLKEDGSNPGAEFSRRVASDLLNTRIVELPAGMDLNDFYLAKGLQDTRTQLGIKDV
jgi:DNA primase